MFALTNSGLGLAEAHVDLVWKVLVEGALTPEAAGELCEPYAPESKLVGSKGHSPPAPMEEKWNKNGWEVVSFFNGDLLDVLAVAVLLGLSMTVFFSVFVRMRACVQI